MTPVDAGVETGPVAARLPVFLGIDALCLRVMTGDGCVRGRLDSDWSSGARTSTRGAVEHRKPSVGPRTLPVITGGGVPSRPMRLVLFLSAYSPLLVLLAILESFGSAWSSWLCGGLAAAS